MMSRAEGKGGSQYPDDVWCREDGVKSSCTSHLRQGLAREVVDDDASTRYRTPWYSTRVASDRDWCKPTAAYVPTHDPRHRWPCPIKCVKSYNRSVGYTRDCKRERHRSLQRYIKGRPQQCDTVTKGWKSYFFPKIVWHHLWTTL